MTTGRFYYRNFLARVRGLNRDFEMMLKRDQYSDNPQIQSVKATLKLGMGTVFEDQISLISLHSLSEIIIDTVFV